MGLNEPAHLAPEDEENDINANESTTIFVIDLVMTPAEIERKYGLGAGTVRQYLSRNGRYLQGTGEARQPDGRTWLILRSTAEQIWGNSQT